MEKKPDSPNFINKIKTWFLKKSLMQKSVLLMLLVGLLPSLIFGLLSIFIISKSDLLTTVFGILMAFLILLIFLIELLIYKRTVLPINKVIDTFYKIQNRNIKNTQKLSLNTKEEIEELGNLFNSFIEAREDNSEQEKLQQKLNDRNKELQDALEKLKKTQIQMLQQEKLAGIGQLAAGVAHEINNPLGYVSGNADMLYLFIQRYENILNAIDEIRKNNMCMDQMDQGSYSYYINELWKNNKIDLVRENIPEMMHDITEGLKRIAEIVNGLRSFSRNNHIDENNSYDLNEGIKTTLLVANNETKYKCEIVFEEGSIPNIYANGGQINQVLLNIIINAAHAIKQKYVKGKGRIHIKTYYEHKFVFCKITDDGCGMTEEVKKRALEPFFTTKPVGQGTGLGLGIAYDIICNKHGGSIEIDSQPGEGTSITFSLPVNETFVEDKI